MPTKGCVNGIATPICPADVLKCIQISDHIMNFFSPILMKNHNQLHLLGRDALKIICGALGRVESKCASHRPEKLVLGLGWILMTMHSFHHKR